MFLFRSGCVALLALLMLGCANVGTPTAGIDGHIDQASTRTFFPSVESAALAAFAHVQANTAYADRFAVALGTIRGEGEGFRFSAPRHEGSLVGRWYARGEIRLSPADVAQYVVYPVTGRHEVDYANRRIAKAFRRFIEEEDPLRRPVFLLNSRGRVIRYEPGRRSLHLGRLRDLLEERSDEEAGSALVTR